MKLLSIIIINYKTPDLTTQCLESLASELSNSKNLSKINTQVIVVDNNSGDGSVEILKKKFTWVDIIESKKNLGFTGGNNLGIKHCKAKYYLLLNSDTVVLPDAISKLVEVMEEKNYGILSCKLLNPDKTLQPNVGELPDLPSLFFWLSGIDDLLRKFINIKSFHIQDRSFYLKEREVGWVSGSVLMIRHEVIDKIGLLDEKMFMYSEDTEICLRARQAGFKVGWTNQASIIHLGGASSSNPHYVQWLGEFKGLLYIYQKYFGKLKQLLLKGLIYFFVCLRMIAFLLLGRFKIVATYGKILRNL